MKVDWKVEGTPLIEHPLFEDCLERLKKFREAIVACEAELSENARIIRRQIDFMLCSLEYFQRSLETHSLLDLK